jgi:hypothetical protein
MLRVPCTRVLQSRPEVVQFGKGDTSMKHWNRYLFSLSALTGAALIGYAHEAYACVTCGSISSSTSYHNGCYASTSDPWSDPYTYGGIKSGGGWGNCYAESYKGSQVSCNYISFSDDQTHYGACGQPVTGMRACRDALC